MKISNQQLFDNFIETLGYLDEKNLIQSEEIIIQIYQELEGDSFTFFHESALDKLILNQKISVDLKENILSIREEIQKLESDKYSIKEIKFSPEWMKIRSIANEVLTKIGGL